jgi:hypothetical protein
MILKKIFYLLFGLELFILFFIGLIYVEFSFLYFALLIFRCCFSFDFKEKILNHKTYILHFFVATIFYAFLLLTFLFYVKSIENTFFLTPDSVGHYIPEILNSSNQRISEIISWELFLSPTGNGFRFFHGFLSYIFVLISGSNSLYWHYFLVCNLGLFSVLLFDKYLSNNEYTLDNRILGTLLFSFSILLPYSSTLVRDVHVVFLFMLLLNVKTTGLKGLLLSLLCVFSIGLFRPTHFLFGLFFIALQSRFRFILIGFLMSLTFILYGEILTEIFFDKTVGSYIDFHAEEINNAGGIKVIMTFLPILKPLILVVQMHFNPLALFIPYQTGSGITQYLSLFIGFAYLIHFIVITHIFRFFIFSKNRGLVFETNKNLIIYILFIFFIFPIVSNDIRRLIFCLPLVYKVFIDICCIMNLSLVSIVKTAFYFIGAGLFLFLIF